VPKSKPDRCSSPPWTGRPTPGPLSWTTLAAATPHCIAHFEAVRQALALMDHPHIAHVLDAGATISGRPFFVMELVRGVPITDYCDRNNLCPRERLELFVHVCQALQHVDQKGVIHRDLKPSNIRVTLHDSGRWLR
jgi:serine/threonine protein kinase